MWVHRENKSKERWEFCGFLSFLYYYINRFVLQEEQIGCGISHSVCVHRLDSKNDAYAVQTTSGLMDVLQEPRFAGPERCPSPPNATANGTKQTHTATA